MHTLTTLQYSSIFYGCTYHIFYGPIFLPNLTYLLSQIKDTDADTKAYIDNIAYKDHFVKSEELKQLVPCCLKLFKEYQELFLSGKGLERYYIVFTIPKKRIVKRLMIGSTFKVVILNSRWCSLSLYRAEAARSLISRLMNTYKKNGYFQPYIPTTLQPEEVLNLTIKILDKDNKIMARTRILVLLSLLRYQEIKKKPTMN